MVREYSSVDRGVVSDERRSRLVLTVWKVLCPHSFGLAEETSRCQVHAQVLPPSFTHFCAERGPSPKFLDQYGNV